MAVARPYYLFVVVNGLVGYYKRFERRQIHHQEPSSNDPVDTARTIAPQLYTLDSPEKNKKIKSDYIIGRD